MKKDPHRSAGLLTDETSSAYPPEGGGSSCHSLSSNPWPRRPFTNFTAAAIAAANRTKRKNFFFLLLFLTVVVSSATTSSSHFVVGLDGLEPSTSPLSGARSNRAELQARCVMRKGENPVSAAYSRPRKSVNLSARPADL